MSIARDSRISNLTKKYNNHIGQAGRVSAYNIVYRPIKVRVGLTLIFLIGRDMSLNDV